MLLRTKVDLILLDSHLSDRINVSIISEIHQKFSDIPVIVISEKITPEIAAESIKNGAKEYIRKSRFLKNPMEVQQKINTLFIHSAVTKKGHNTLQKKKYIPNLTAYKTVYMQAEFAIKGGLSLLIYGETGVGKNILVSHLHELIMPDCPLVSIDCGSIPKELIESELFGYEEGAFTGATRLKKGKIELANGGILFLDELSNAPINVQTRLLRVLQEKKICRVGGTVDIHVDFILISASNKDLLDEVQHDRFKEDLFYRVKQVDVLLPSISKCPSIIQSYMRHYVEHYNYQYQTDFDGDSVFLRYLIDREWPGNLRELDLEIQKIIFAHSIGVNYMELFQLTFSTCFSNDLKAQLYVEEREEIINALKNNRHKVSGAARELKIPRTTLHSRMKRYGICL